ncbi:hypothetical protein QBC46DRAFT_376470 [Diplogelasinospora grovesii]|uniref:Pentatricopeptide repeat protein n=1 Tax=Diplogelasinospora grovesii TaxID=303347 RepID=A0AAN6S815_9PEZI|nr:hypothetical protein QBC46DRAFT_376470 [Diplogelasinospora grovesii]
MAPTRFIFDGLWRCLCPSIDAAALVRAVNKPYPFSPTARRSRNRPRNTCPASTRGAHWQTESARPRDDAEKAITFEDLFSAPTDAKQNPKQPKSSISFHLGKKPGNAEQPVTFKDLFPESLDPKKDAARSKQSSSSQNTDTAKSENQVKQSSVKPESSRTASSSATFAKDAAQTATVSDLIQTKGSFPALKNAPTPVIYECLRELARRQGQSKKIRAFVQYLIEQRGERPNIFLYEALVTANWDQTGSADELDAILEQMRKAGIEPSPNIYHSALRLLAVHPDYLLRNIILRNMRARWIDVRPDGKLSVALGLLRDGQYEMAIDQLDQMAKEGVTFPNWVYDIFIYTFGRLGFMDEAVQLLHQRLLQKDAKDDGEGEGMSLNVWYFLLDECSRNLHYEGTKYVWQRMVEPGILNPSDGITLNVLNTASRSGDAELATKAIQHLSSRRAKLGLHHYEALVDCYAQSGDLDNAFQVLCILTSAGLQADQASTRSIFGLLKKAPAGMTDAAVQLLFDLRKKGEKIPIAALNVVLEALVEHGRLPNAVDLYTHVRQLVPAGPNFATFQLLLARSENAEMANFLCAEMKSFSVRPNMVMYDAIVRSFARDGDLEIAFSYLSEMSNGKGKGKETGWLSQRTVLVLVERCFKDEDPRAWNIIDEAKNKGMDIEQDVQKMVATIQAKKKIKEVSESSVVTKGEKVAVSS